MEGAFDAWYRAEHPRVLGVCVALSGDGDAARDATDEAFARALDRWKRVSVMESPAAWVQTVALNCLRRILRRRAHERRAATRWLAGPPRESIAGPVAHREVWAAVRALPERQRLATVLRYVADLPEDEIARAMGVTRGTVSSCLAAARRSLAALLDDGADTEETVP